MNKLLVGFGLSVMLSLPLLAALKPGEKAPDFSAKGSLAGKEFSFSLQNALKKGPVVVYFYPSAFTKGCDLEAHTFAEQKDKFDAAGATIIGVSADSLERLHEFGAVDIACRLEVGKKDFADGPITMHEEVDLQLDDRIVTGVPSCMCRVATQHAIERLDAAHRAGRER